MTSLQLPIASRLGAVLSRGILTVGALVAALALQAQDSHLSTSKEHTSSSANDPASCIKEVAQMNMATIKFAELASQKAQNSELKEYAEKLEKDHEKAQEKLETIAKDHDVTLPTSVDAKCQEELTKLKAYTGAQFDREFAKGAVQGHAMAVKKLQEASTSVKDSDLSQYLKNMLSTVKEHQEKGREIAKAVGIDQSTIASLERPTPEGVGSPGESITERGVGSPQTSDQEDHDAIKDTPHDP